jgi:hypothetical protein
MNRTIKPRVVTQTKNRIEIVLIEPQRADWIYISTIVIISFPLAWYTTPDWKYFAVCLVFYWLLAYSLVEDTFVTVIDIGKNSVEVTQSKLGFTKMIRASNCDELINVVFIN